MATGVAVSTERVKKNIFDIKKFLNRNRMDI